jgi:hypothetical protein
MALTLSIYRGIAWSKDASWLNNNGMIVIDKIIRRIKNIEIIIVVTRLGDPILSDKNLEVGARK